MEDEITIDQAIEKIGFGKFQVFLILICGIIQAADAMEMLLISILGPVLQCEWKLDSAEVAIITTAVFVGKWTHLLSSYDLRFPKTS